MTKPDITTLDKLLLLLSVAMALAVLEMPRRATMWRKTLHGIARRPNAGTLRQDGATG